MNKKLIIAIDGPSGAGKSTLSKQLAVALGYVNIDTGAMYRAVALLAVRQQIDLNNAVALGHLCRSLQIEFRQDVTGELVLVNGEDVSLAIRAPEVSLQTSKVAACPAVREELVRLQQQMGQEGGVVLEGRDIGTVVFPQAQVKFFLTASAQERGRRRFNELRAQGIEVDLQQTTAEVEARDAADRSRALAPLKQAEDAIVIDSSQMTLAEVKQRMLEEVERRMSSVSKSGERT